MGFRQRPSPEGQGKAVGANCEFSYLCVLNVSEAHVGVTTVVCTPSFGRIFAAPWRVLAAAPWRVVAVI